MPSKPRGRPKQGIWSESIANARELSLKQLKDVIGELYAAKAKYDLKCEEDQLPRETMEEFLYTYLQQKYGLRSLVVEWGSAVVQGIRKYSAADNDTLVFGKILRNEIDENFRLVQQQLKETVKELLRVFLKNANPHKLESAIAKLLSQRTTGFVTEDECLEIVRWCYDEGDATEVIDRLGPLFEKEQAAQAPPPSRGTRSRAPPSGPRKCKYADFLEVLLAFQLHGVETYMEKFTTVFQHIDSDQDGVITMEDFKHLMEELSQSVGRPCTADDLEDAQEAVERYGLERVTFSTAISYASHTVLNSD
mmetsp:Transcript_86499/g.197376  ORF Transcript_86499/g.197376 Transcript_86499/m.197376 type:complete len:307 (+) Transcript_86499:325-1245(+)